MNTPVPAARPRSRWRRSGIGLRLLAAQAIVLAAGAVTTSVVAAVV
ncbi:two-component sensor histidine kinase, partial [Mycobacterium sp. ITM-2017-0098]